MKQMDIKLYKLKVVKGKEKTAKEWLAFLEANKDEGTETLKNDMGVMSPNTCYWYPSFKLKNLYSKMHDSTKCFYEYRFNIEFDFMFSSKSFTRFVISLMHHCLNSFIHEAAFAL